MVKTINQNGVRTRHKDYDKYAAKWKRCRDVMEGQAAIHAAGELYLPKLTGQSAESYKGYKTRANFYNASWRTVAGLVGMMFRKPPKQELPAGVKDFTKDITFSGVPIDQFAQLCGTEILEVGRVGLLVDFPSPPVNDDGTPITLAQAEAVGLRPSINTYETETIINWKFRRIANKKVLAMVVLEEVHEEPDGEFGSSCEVRQRVLDLTPDTNEYRIRIYHQDASGKDEQIGADEFPLMNNAPINFIPFVCITPDGCEIDLDDPPLMDLVDLNVDHYQITADYKHGLHLSGLPTFYITGTVPTDDKGKQKKIYVGSEAALQLPDTNAKAAFAEVTSKFEAHRTALDANKQEMATLGARMLADASTKQVETFGATAIKHVAENSILASIAISLSQGMVTALGWFCDWANAHSDSIVYDVNRDFMPVQMDAQTLTALMMAWQQGGLSEPELFDLFKRGDLIEADKSLEDHQGEIDASPPPAPPSNVSPGALGTMTPEEQLAHDKKTQDTLQPEGPPKP